MSASENLQAEPSQNAKTTPKWSAIIGDRLAPMARQRLKAEDILHQSGTRKNVILVRDYNGPNDVGFEADAVVDLAEGNVFRVAQSCERLGQATCKDPAKLAFVADDRFEITIQPKQTGRTLRGLLAIPHEFALLRDLESPHDVPVNDDDHIQFADGPVFVTRHAEGRKVTVIVEGTPHNWDRPAITYVEVATLFDPTYPQHPETTYSVTYDHGPRQNPEGILSPGGSVKVRDRMVFHVSTTGQS